VANQDHVVDRERSDRSGGSQLQARYHSGVLDRTWSDLPIVRLQSLKTSKTPASYTAARTSVLRDCKKCPPPDVVRSARGAMIAPSIDFLHLASTLISSLPSTPTDGAYAFFSQLHNCTSLLRHAHGVFYQISSSN
jgi:hypothetical protein